MNLGGLILAFTRLRSPGNGGVETISLRNVVKGERRRELRKGGSKKVGLGQQQCRPLCRLKRMGKQAWMAQDSMTDETQALRRGGETVGTGGGSVLDRGMGRSEEGEEEGAAK